MLCPLPLREKATQDVQQTRSGEGSRPDPSPDLQVPPPSSPLPQGERALSRAPFFLMSVCYLLTITLRMAVVPSCTFFNPACSAALSLSGASTRSPCRPKCAHKAS